MTRRPSTVAFGMLLAALPALAGDPAPPARPQSRPASAAPATPGTTAPTRVEIGSLAATVPAGWIREEPTSKMRRAQYKLARAAGDTEDAQLVVFQFGAAPAGSVEANLDRWKAQLEPEKDKAPEPKIGRGQIHGMKFTRLDVYGRYRPDVMPGNEEMDRPGYRMVAAIVEAADGPYYFKIIGPRATVAAHEMAIAAFLASLEPR